VLQELVIENFAVIDRLRIRFHSGLNLLTGETGSGKSIVVDALGLLLGGRASAELIRSGAERARVSGIFSLSEAVRGNPALDGFELEEGEILIERELLGAGKSRAFVDSRPVTASVLKALAPCLGDIHGQHEQQQLFEPGSQLAMLDGFAGVSTAEVAALYRAWSATGGELEEMERTEQEKLRLLDLWSFQKGEIEAAGLKPGEDAALEAERRVLMNLSRIQENAGAAYEALYESPQSALGSLRTASRKLEDLARVDTAFDMIAKTLEPAAIAVQEAADSLRDYLSRLEASPERLDWIEERLATLDKLKRKYGATVEDVLEFLEGTRRQIDAVENAEQHMSALRKQREQLARAYEAAAATLTRLRSEAVRKLEKQVVKELASLAMERTVFRIEISAGAWSETGADQLRFLVSANLGEEPRPLERVASGGELSRIALALKTCLTGRESARTLVFDEVDAGVGGRAAEGIGRRLKRLASRDQVLCVTHLPQVAGFADHHYSVTKRASGGRTIAEVVELDAEGRVRELGRMLSGENLTDAALAHARELIAGSRL